MIEPPDILFLQAVKIVPKPPHKLEPFDAILIRVANAFSDQPIADAFFITPEGDVDLGPGLWPRESGRSDDGRSAGRDSPAAVAISLITQIVSVSLAAASGAQQISGEHLVGPDGRVNLATYGQVYVAGLTLDQAREAIQKHLSQLS